MRELRHVLTPPMTDFTAIYTTLSQMTGCFTIVNAPQGCTQILAGDFAGLGMDDTRVGNVDIENLSLTFGAEDKVKRAVSEVDEIFSPSYIALVPAPVSALIGVDLAGVSRDLEGKVRARILPFPLSTMEGPASKGEEDLYATLAAKVAGRKGAAGRKVNLIGLGFQEYNRRSDVREIQRLLYALGAEPGERFGMEGHLPSIASGAGDAGLNLALSESGVKAAEILQERFGTPFVPGLPFGFEGTEKWLRKIGSALGLDPEWVIADEKKRFRRPLEDLLHYQNDPLSNAVETLTVAISAPGMYGLGLASFLCRELGLEIGTLALQTHISPSDIPDVPGFQRETVLLNPSEDQVSASFEKNPPDLVFGDTYFHRLCGAEKPFLPVSNPYLLSGGFYDDSPYLGFRGALFLAESLTHRINMNGEFVRFHRRRFRV